MSAVVLVEALGFLCALVGLFAWIGRPRSVDEGRRAGAMVALLVVQALVHASDSLEWFGFVSLDRLGDDLRVFVPLAWLVFLFGLRHEQDERDLVGERAHTEFFLTEAPVAAAVLTREGDALFVSREWAARCGCESSDLRGVRLSSDPRGPSALVREILATVAETGETVRRETPSLVAWGGKQEWVIWQARGRRSTPGRPALVTLVVQVQTEEFLAENRQRVEARTLFEAHRVDLVGQLAATVAHDLNNFLYAITANAEGLDARATREEVEQARESILEAAASSSDLVRSLTGLARSKGATEQLDLVALVRSTASLLHRSMPLSIRLELELPREPQLVVGDRSRLQQALVNLVVNARDAMPEGGVLSVALGGDETNATLSVSDTGVGVPPDLRARIFERFFTTKVDQNGTGLGLSQVAAVVDEHHGRLELDSELGRGTTFRLVLPRDRDSLSGHRPVAERRATG